jgi:hypothetical protein
VRRLLVTGRAARGVAVVAALLTLGGCADRGLAASPPSDPGTGTWAVVTVAAVAASVMVAALIVLPALRPGGSVIASWVLGLQAGGVAVTGAILVGAAIRSEQLLHRPPDAEQAASLLRLSVLDGRDSGFFTLIVLVTLVVGGLLIAMLALAARFAADRDHVERILACGLLAFEVAASVGCVVVVTLGFTHLGFVLPALALPVLVVATVAAWPREADPDPTRRQWG